MLLHVPDGYKPEQVWDAPAAKIKTLPESLTWDQGPEMRDWKQVSVDADIDICDPHSPWQLTLAARHQRELQRPTANTFQKAPTCSCTAATISTGRPGTQRPAS